MEQSPQAMFLTDDAAARLVAEQMGFNVHGTVAEQMGFNVHGTIGILVRSIRRGQMSPKEVLDVLTKVPLKTTLYIRHSLLEEILLRIKNEFNL